MGKRRKRSHQSDGFNLETLPKKAKRNVAQDLLDASLNDYILSGGLRFVRPYAHEFVMTCKQRWLGRPLIDVLESELAKEFPNYWQREFSSGRITVGGQPASPTRPWGAQDKIVHMLHRHESPVLCTAEEIYVVWEDERVVVVDKPASVPIHPCGTYRKNSLVYILAAHGWKDLRVVHRLDKQTSGIVVFAKTKEAATELCDVIAGRSVRKRYLARVIGQFPGDAVVRCDESLAVDEAMNSSRVSPNGKTAETLFYRVGHDEVTGHSLVLAEPITGRSHQIRVHLQYLGYPIANDPLYNDAQRARLAGVKAARGSHLSKLPHRLRLDELDASLVETASIAKAGEALGCDNCPYLANALGVDRSDDMLIYLHAHEYEWDDWKCTARIPDWAKVFDGLDVESLLKSKPTLRGLESIKLPRRALPKARQPSWCIVT